ncbi:hypothetical protein QQS21_000561 [Conoideocrella luteorostrata]|uniref:Uncharacterized protein n=1 Tax=Conoideocrella luteorostrata TaxID=1105319 RepID=A0AAJ0CYW3_9HYPO|nr:hypothetical protein QQS21_000561 [Conoideocrella luteorostrata]
MNERKRAEEEEERAEETLLALQGQMSETMGRLAHLRRRKRILNQQGSELFRRGLISLELEASKGAEEECDMSAASRLDEDCIADAAEASIVQGLSGTYDMDTSSLGLHMPNENFNGIDFWMT